MAGSDEIERRMIRAAMSAPYLRRDDERALAERWRDARDEQALSALTRAHMRLVVAMAARYRRYGLPMADLMQEGHVGLLEAAARFEPERDIRFSTYASWWIRAAIQDFVLRNWSIVRGGTSSGQKALFFNLRRIRARLAREHPEEAAHATLARVARELGVAATDVEAMDARLSGADMQLDAPMAGEDGPARGESLIDPAPRPDEVVAERIDAERLRAELQHALLALSQRELRIVQERRLREDGVTLEALGSRLGISKERVRQIEVRALDKLRRLLKNSPSGPGTPAHAS
jgi:RNA polymerase sigma-32 factor